MIIAQIYYEVICLFKGHKRARKTVETATTVHKFSCSRCGCPLDIGFWKNVPAPPGMCAEEWNVAKLEFINDYLKR